MPKYACIGLGQFTVNKYAYKIDLEHRTSQICGR